MLLILNTKKQNNIITYRLFYYFILFSQELEELPEQYRKSVSLFMSYVHQSVNEMSSAYLQNEKRYNYTTPKSFLEQIALYSKLLGEKVFNLKSMILRLENGLTKLASCAGQVKIKE